MVRYRELQYRTLNELIDTVSADLRVYYGDGTIEIMELIKIVQKCNYELGLQIQQTKETVLEVEHFRAKLPADFNFLNFAFICHEYHSVTPLPGNGLVQVEEVTQLVSPDYTTVPCQVVTVIDQPQTATVTYSDGSTASVLFQVGTTSLCAISVTGGNPVFISVSTDHNCIKLPSGQLSCTPLPCNTCTTPTTSACTGVDTDPWKQNKVYTVCNDTVQIEIVQENKFEIRRYRNITPLYIQPNKQASAFSSYDAFRLRGNNAILRDGFIETAFECGTIYLNYQGVLENENGELLVLNHPMINLWYEAEVSYRILRNLYINGEPDIERRLQLLDRERKEEKSQAMRIAYTPDYSLMKQTIEIARHQEFQKHFAAFSRYYGVHGWSIQFDKWFNGRYLE